MTPSLVLSTALLPLTPQIVDDLGTSTTWLQVTNGLANAGLALGVVVASMLAQRFVQRPLFLGYAAAFLVGSVLVVLAPSLPLFLAGRVVQGGATGLMVISALPPLMTGFGAGPLPRTMGLASLGIFGGTTLGPLVGGYAADAAAWRTLMWVVVGAAVAGVVVAALGYPDLDPLDPDLPIDRSALALATTGVLLTYLATSLVATVTLASYVFWVLFVAGTAAVVVLVLVERGKDTSLMPVRELSTQLPVTGTLVAMIAGAATVTVVELVQLHLAGVAKESPAAAGLLFWPMPLGLAVASVAITATFRTRYLPVLVNIGLGALAVATAALLLLSASNVDWLAPAATAVLGFGAGATIAPGLFLAGLGVRADLLGRAFALVQLLRLTASFAVGPVVVHLAQTRSSLASGIDVGLWISLGLVLAGLVVSLVVPALSGAELHEPDLEAWLDGERGMWSPATGAEVRDDVPDAG
nr:MFS transporter [Nocardioides luti]